MSRIDEVTVTEYEQLTIDGELGRLIEQLKDRGRVQAGATRLLSELVRRGLAERDVPVAAALVIQADIDAAERRRGR